MPERRPPERQEPAETPAGILVIEDDPIVAMHVEEVLGALGFRDIKIAYDLASAMAVISAKLPALALLDVNIRGDLVFPIAAALREHRIPFVFVTGRAREDLPVEWSGHPVLAKPLSPKALAEALAGLGVP